jgi:hypothetical protein
MSFYLSVQDIFGRPHPLFLSDGEGGQALYFKSPPTIKHFNFCNLFGCSSLCFDGPD